MHRSHWDLEVHAKDVQERRLQEAARQLRIDEAMGMQVNPFDLGIARLVRSAKAWLATGLVTRASPTRANETGASATSCEPALEPVVRTPQSAPTRLAQPYADMVVIARAPMARATEQPRVSSDC